MFSRQVYIQDITMEDYSKVIVSNIKTNENIRTGELYDLLKVTPAKPLSVTHDKSYTCDFCPKTGKQYIPKKKSKLKVKTVREIRNVFEQDTYAYLTNDLEKQQDTLFQIIKSGNLGNENTKTLASKMLNSEQPISRSTWLMLANVNPEEYKYTNQFVLWNGQHIQVNGSKGGNNKFIVNVDLGLTRNNLRRKTILGKKFTPKKNGLLRNSLNIKFKPGPLGRKKYLDDSHQKYHVGGIELIDLPKPGLDIQPLYGTKLEPTVTRFLSNLRGKDGAISKKWAEFSVSVLGKLKKSTPVQLSKEYVSFNLGYIFDQHRILMRRDCDNILLSSKETDDSCGKYEMDVKQDGFIVFAEIKEVLGKMLDFIEISFEQENIFSDAEPRSDAEEPICTKPNIQIKDKTKKKYGELDRLDVTVIQMPDNQPRNPGKLCDKLYCVLGCICDSLECRFKLKQHCGRVGCMFECKCDFSKCTDIDSLQSECSSILPGLINLKKQINFNLSKEEKKFHQTVIVTGEKSILLKSQKRNCKISKKYSDFYTEKSLKTNIETPKLLSINCIQLSCKNIEPWCMVHNLYKCFCKGRFVEISTKTPTSESTNHTLPQKDINDGTTLKDNIKSICVRNRSSAEAEPKHGDLSKRETRTNKEKHNNQSVHVPDMTELHTQLYSECARIKGYQGRKYTDGYYFNTNNKILEMEKNDRKLRKKVVALRSSSSITLSGDEKSESSDFEETVSFAGDDISVKPTLQEVQPLRKNTCDVNIATFTSKYLPNKTTLKSWVESNYKLYKQRMDEGSITALNPPKQGKVALHSWDFILNRYRERKNIFLVTKQKPYRIFVAVKANIPFLENCINIDDIRFADIDKYPITVKSLLTNTNGDRDDFCILRGLSICWELIGSVKKVNKDQNQDQIEDDINLDQSSGISSNIDTASKGNEAYVHEQTENKKSITNVSVDIRRETSKWFLMTIENDFTAMQFYRRGFFVRFESITKAINVARVSGKTVRLSVQKCCEKSKSPQFGIYAIPNYSEQCVFIGPYEIDEVLGIETVKTLLSVRNTRKTRGIWITTNTIDNSEVISNPMSFILPTQYHEMIPLDNVNSSVHVNKESNCPALGEKRKEAPKKPVRPIKVRKTDGFYLAPNGLLQKKSPNKIETDVIGKSFIRNTSLCDLSTLKPLLESNIVPETHSDVPISESESEKVHKKPERGMLILKPEEINKRILESKISFPTNVRIIKNIDTNKTDTDVMDLDIEPFITTTAVLVPQTNENFSISLISDDEEDVKAQSNDKSVFILSTNIKGLGWIRAKRNNEGLLSFQFPGFTFSPYYEDDETFSKINEVFSRKIYIPKNITLSWEVVESVDKSIDELKSEDLNSNFILTKQGIQHKNDISPTRNKIKTYSRKLLKDLSLDLPSRDESLSSNDSMDETGPTITELEQTSASLEDETEVLWDQTVSNKSEIMNSLMNMPDILRETMTKSLKSIKEMSEM